MIEVRDLSFGYHPRAVFIKGMNFRVDEGEIFGFLGPSGAGKTTVQKILTGLQRSYGGSAQVAGKEARSAKPSFYEDIGVDFEYSTLYGKLSARENLAFFAGLYRKPSLPVDELLAKVGLLADADKKVQDYSKGMKSRLNFVKALAHRPRVLFLDEPTSGLDPVNARLMKDLILEEKARGTTILLTTHHMHDAAELCHRVAFLVDGEIRALDSPRSLVLRKGAGQITYSWMEGDRELQASVALDATGSDPRLADLLARGALRTIHSQEPGLADLFLELTGRKLT